MVHIWDYDKKQLEQTKEGRIKILELMINYGVYLKDKQKIPIKQVKKYWTRLKLDPERCNYLKFLIWGK